MNGLLKRCFGGAGLAALAFGATSAVPADAGAHCGDHAGSCGGWGWDYTGYSFCNGAQPHIPAPGTWWAKVGYWQKNCSGTCYNGNQGCCISPEACSDSACKPGGCGSDCLYDPAGYYWEDTGLECW